MTKTLTVSQENYEKLVELKGKLMTKRKKSVSINDALTFLLEAVKQIQGEEVKK